MDQAYTYRADRRYVQMRSPSSDCPYCIREITNVGLLRWCFYRAQFWRFFKFKHNDVLRERGL